MHIHLYTVHSTHYTVPVLYGRKKTILSLKLTGINAETWHELAEDRTAWGKAVKKEVRSFEDDRVKAREDKRLKRKANEALNTIVQQIPSANFVCQTCGRACQSRIGLYSHSRTHPQQH